MPVRHDLFLVHAEEAAIDGLATRLNGVVAAGDIFRPVLDETFELTGIGVFRLSISTPPRLGREKLARLDWHNDVSRLILDIKDALASTADEKARDVLIRRLQRPLEDGEAEPHGTRRR